MYFFLIFRLKAFQRAEKQTWTYKSPATESLVQTPRWGASDICQQQDASMMEMGTGGKFGTHCIRAVELIWSSETWKTGFHTHKKRWHLEEMALTPQANLARLNLPFQCNLTPE